MLRRFLSGMLWVCLALGGAFVTLLGVVDLGFSAGNNDGRSDAEVFGVTLPIKPYIVGWFITIVGVSAFIAAWLLNGRWATKRRARH